MTAMFPGEAEGKIAKNSGKQQFRGSKHIYSLWANIFIIEENPTDC
jgi:hypothetical protein